jgi:hypothetical protein
LTRLAQRHPEAREWLAGALNGRLPRLARIAVEVAVETGDPIGRVLALEVKKGCPPDLILNLLRLCQSPEYWGSIPLLELSLVLVQFAFGLFSYFPEEVPEPARLKASADLSLRLSQSLHALGERQLSLHLNQESVELFRQLARDHSSFPLGVGA